MQEKGFKICDFAMARSQKPALAGSLWAQSLLPSHFLKAEGFSQKLHIASGVCGMLSSSVL